MDCVAIGGTFEVRNDGHKEHLRRRDTIGEMIIEHVTDEMAQKKFHVVNTYNNRKKSLIAYLETLTGAPPLIVALSYPYGPTLAQKFDYIVVSPDTRPTAKK